MGDQNGPLPPHDPQDDRALEIGKRVRAQEWLEAELVANLGGVFRALSQGDTEAASALLADHLLLAYSMGQLLGVSPVRLEGRMASRLRRLVEEGHALERWFGLLSKLQGHFWRQPSSPDRR